MDSDLHDSAIVFLGIGDRWISVRDGGVLRLQADLSDFGKVLLPRRMLLRRFGPLLIGLYYLIPPVHIPYRVPKDTATIE
jgi:hypothetical protein